MWVGRRRTKNLEESVSLLESACQSWKEKSLNSEAMADYWMNETIRLRKEGGPMQNNEQAQRELQELLTYWKGVAIAKEREVEAVHKDNTQLRNDLKQQRFLRQNQQEEINRLRQQVAELKKETL